PPLSSGNETPRASHRQSSSSFEPTALDGSANKAPGPRPVLTHRPRGAPRSKRSSARAVADRPPRQASQDKPRLRVPLERSLAPSRASPASSETRRLRAAES